MLAFIEFLYSIVIIFSAYRSPNIWQLGHIDASHIPGQCLGHRIEGVLALIRRQQAVEHASRHGQLQLHLVHGATQGVPGPNRQIQTSLLPRFDREIVPDVDGYGHHGLGAYVVW